MHSNRRLMFGAVLILLGLLLLLQALTGLDFWVYCWPTALILLGVWLIFRPKLSSDHSESVLRPLADISRRGVWQVIPQEFWIFVGDIDLDMLEAEIPFGETEIRVNGFVGEVKLIVPANVGVVVSSTAFVTDADVLGEKVDHLFSVYHNESPNYSSAEKKIHLKVSMFVASISVKQIL